MKTFGGFSSDRFTPMTLSEMEHFLENTFRQHYKQMEEYFNEKAENESKDLRQRIRDLEKRVQGLEQELFGYMYTPKGMEK